MNKGVEMDFRIINSLMRQTRYKTLQTAIRNISRTNHYLPTASENTFQPQSIKLRNSSIFHKPPTCRFFSTQHILRNEETPKLERPEGMGGSRKKPEQPSGTPVGWRNLVVAGGVIAILMGTYYYIKGKKDEIREKNRKGEIGKSKIGGTFDLVDQYGNPKKSEDYHGKWVLLYFGFTHCPDICPDEMEKMAEVYDMLKEAKRDSPEKKLLGDVVPLMITVDPERDGVQQMKEYCKEFHPELVGLTSTPEKIMQACKAFRVYFSAGPRDDDDDYIVDHTIIIYLLDPEGQFVDYYGQTKTAKQIVQSVKVQMGKYNMARQ